MVQIYFLLVALNVLSGLILVRSGLKIDLGIWDGWFAPFDHRMVRGLVGVATFLSGFLGLIFVLPGDQIFLGDLFPGTTALLGGTILILDYYQKPKDTENSPKPDWLVGNRLIVGVLCLAFGLIHFVTPVVMFL